MKNLVKGTLAIGIAVAGLFAVATPALAQNSDDYYENKLIYATTTPYPTLTDEEAAGLMATMFGIAGANLLFVALVCCCALAFAVGFAYVIYNDAKNNNVANGVLWAILEFILTLVFWPLGVIFLLIYFLAIKNSGSSSTSTPTQTAV